MNMAIPESTPCSFLLSSVYMSIYVPPVHFARRFLLCEPGESNLAVPFRGPVVGFAYP